MNTDDEDLTYRTRTRVIQIIAGAILAGLLMFIAIVAIMVMNDNQPGRANAFGDLPLLSLMGCGLLAVNLPLSVIVPSAMAKNGVRQLAARTGENPQTFTGELINVWQTSFIVSRALLEGAGFLGALAYMVEKHWLGLAVALAVALIMLVTFPTEGRIRAWVERQQAALDEMRLQSGR
jgi:hypothetical protein